MNGITLLLAAGASLTIGAALAVVARTNTLRAASAIASQVVACVATLLACAGPLLHGADIDASWQLGFPLDQVDTHVDALSAFFLVWSLPMTLLGTIYAAGYLRPWFRAGRNGAPHFALLNTIALSFLIVYSAQNALVFLLGWELAAVAAWLTVIWDYRIQKVRFAGFNYLVSTHIGLLALVAAFMFLHGQTGSLTFDSFGAYLSVPSGGRSIVFILLGLAFALKSAFFPVHSWLPRAHAAAPAHVSALMSGVIHKAGLFAFLRFTVLLDEPEEWMGWAVLAYGAASAVFGVLYSASQRDLKRLLGYSSTENVGIAAMGFGLGYLGLAWHQPALVALGMLGGLLHVLNHALFKCLLFYGAGAVYYATHTVDIERLGGLARRLPRTAVLFGIGALAISGLPPMNGFVSELVLYAGLLRGAAPSPLANAALLCAAALLGFVGAVSAFSMVRAFGLTFLGTPREPHLHLQEEAPAVMLAPMAVHAVGVVLLGLAPTAVIGLGGPLLALFGVPGGGVATVVETVAPFQAGNLVLVGTLVVLGAVGSRLARRARSHVTWGCGYTAGNPRMQYTASSFSQQLARIFVTLLPEQTRVKLSRRVYPRASGHFEVSVADAVELRLYEVLGRGEQFFLRVAATVPEEPRFAFAAGLAAILLMTGLMLAGEGP